MIAKLEIATGLVNQMKLERVHRIGAQNGNTNMPRNIG